MATKRLVDNVCMTMEQDFVVKLLGKVESELFLLTNHFTDVEELFVEVSYTPTFTCGYFFLSLCCFCELLGAASLLLLERCV